MRTKKFALVECGRIKLYPLSEEDINARNAPTEDYAMCVYDTDTAPQTHLYEKIEEKLTLGQYVHVEETVVVRTIDEMFEVLAQLAGFIDSEGKFQINTNAITEDLIDAFEFVVKIKVQKMLDDFAMTRGYDSIDSAVKYTTSSVPRYAQDALRCVDILDAVWSSLFDYLAHIRAGTQAPPTSWNDIAQVIPPLTWE